MMGIRGDEPPPIAPSDSANSDDEQDRSEGDGDKVESNDGDNSNDDDDADDPDIAKGVQATPSQRELLERDTDLYGNLALVDKKAQRRDVDANEERTEEAK